MRKSTYNRLYRKLCRDADIEQFFGDDVVCVNGSVQIRRRPNGISEEVTGLGTGVCETKE